MKFKKYTPNKFCFPLGNIKISYGDSILRN